MKRIGLICVFAGLVGVANANLLTNGGFETGDFTGWSGGGVNVGNYINYPYGPSASTVHSGNYGMQFGAVGHETDIEQVIGTTAGTTYDVSFWVNILDGATNEVTAFANGNAILDMFDPTVGLGWQYESASFVATGPTSTIAFGFRQDPGWSAFDDASVEAVPEPATLAALGFGALALVRRRRAR